LNDDTILSSLSALGLSPSNTSVPTHFTSTSSTLLDSFFVSVASKIIKYDQVSAPQFSHHDCIFLSYFFELERIPNTSTYRDYRNLNHARLELGLDSIDWNYIFNLESVDEQLDFLNDKILYLFNQYVPLKTSRLNKSNKPWFNNEIACLISNRDIAYERWKRYRTPELLTQYKNLRNRVVAEIKKLKKTYYEEKFSNSTGGKQTWNLIRKMGLSSKNLNAVDSADVDVEDINSQFLSSSSSASFSNCPSTFLENYDGFSFSCVNECDVLESMLSIKSHATGLDKIDPKFLFVILPKILHIITFIFNTILTKSVFPQCWKSAKIIPLPKGNGSFRPISILPFLSKVLEKLMYNQINKYLSEKALLSEKQSGFRSNRSCTTALINVTEQIRVALENDEISILVLLDHSKAFDKVDPHIACLKLNNHFNFSSSATRLIKSYLTERTQSVCIGSSKSTLLPLRSGVPQGSILGPLIFNTYINDLPTVLNNCEINMYADDVQLSFKCKTSQLDSGIFALNSDLSRIDRWASENHLEINASKSKCLIIAKRTNAPESAPRVQIGNNIIEYSNTAKNLGIIFNSSLTWNNHISAVTGKVYGLLRSLWTMHEFTPQPIRLLLCKTYLVPVLLYGVEIFANCDSESKRKLNVAFNNIARYVYGLNRTDSVSRYSQSIFSITFDNLLKLRILTFLHRIVYTQQPSFLYNKLRFTHSPRDNKIVPFRHRLCLSERQFFLYAVHLWNLLPSYIQFTANADKFKNLAKHHLESSL